MPTPSNTTEREKLFLIIEPALFNYPDKHYIDIALEQLAQHTAQAVRSALIYEIDQARNYLNLEPQGITYEQEGVLLDRIAELEKEKSS